MNFQKLSGSRLWLTVAAICASSLSSQVWSEPASAVLSLDDAIEAVRRQTDGEVLRATTRTIDGRTVHEIRVLTDEGHVRTLIVDAETGRVQ